MARTATRRSAGTKRSRKARRAFDPKRLPYAEEAQTVTDVFQFLAKTLPDFIDREFERLDVARSESELYRALAGLPDATLQRAGLRREDLPRYILSAFHLVNASPRRKKRVRAHAARAARASARPASATPR